MPNARLFTIRGRVQGVFFRATTRRVAESLGLSGYAINLPNGDVEVLAFGDSGAVDSLGDWLQQGPDMARVDKVSVETVDVDVPAGFQIG